MDEPEAVGPSEHPLHGKRRERTQHVRVGARSVEPLDERLHHQPEADAHPFRLVRTERCQPVQGAQRVVAPAGTVEAGQVEHRGFRLLQRAPPIWSPCSAGARSSRSSTKLFESSLTTPQ